jgi:2-polyprenyl-3-methyl-5-hydroxy-6-metoxy-1,4-benzoquinol methylase
MEFEFVPDSNEEELSYQQYHLPRFKFALKMALKYKKGSAVEVGPYVIATNLIKNGLTVDAIGYLSNKVKGINKHIEFNLESLREVQKPAISGSYDLVIAAEIIEHLNVDLDLIYKQLYALTAPGGVVIIQTPNAVALKKRMAMMMGKNPFEMVRSDYTPGNGGHIREFTIKELQTHAVKNGFSVLETHCLNYFSYAHSFKARLYKFFTDLCPATLRDGVTIVVKRNA